MSKFGHTEGATFPDCECLFCEEMWVRSLGPIEYGKRQAPDADRELLEAPFYGVAGEISLRFDADSMAYVEIEK